MAETGLRRTMEMFIRQNAGDENFENLDPELWTRKPPTQNRSCLGDHEYTVPKYTRFLPTSVP